MPIQEKTSELMSSTFAYNTPQELLQSANVDAPAITPTVTVTAFSVEGVMFTLGVAAGATTISVAAGC